MSVITEVSIFIAKPPDEDTLREITSKFCDVLVSTDFGADPEDLESISSFLSVKQYQVDEDDMNDFVHTQLQDSVLAVIPANKGENDD